MSAGTITVGQTAAASAYGIDQNGSPIGLGAITWSTSSATIADVSASGIVTALTPGQAQIIASAGGKQGQALITVTGVPVAYITVAPTYVVIAGGATKQFTATLKDANGITLTGRTVTWSSSDPSLATVNSVTGVATGIAAPGALITATSEGKTGSASLQVSPTLPVDMVLVNGGTVVVGDVFQFTADLRNNASGQVLAGRSVTWDSSNPTVAKVDAATGLAAALAVGETKVTATSEGVSGAGRLKVVAGPRPTCGNAAQIGCGLGPEQFALIPAGTFDMGSTRSYMSGPIHRVTISKAFYAQRTEFTQGQWKAVMGSNPSAKSSCGDRCPVESVSWDDVQVLIQRLNESSGAKYRLPTEAEWEYMARIGTPGCRDFCYRNMAWIYPVDGDSLHPVAGLQPNSMGLFDLVGNVWEWVSDRRGDYPSEPVTDPSGPATLDPRRVLRGGTFGTCPWCSEYDVDDRGFLFPDSRISNGGFRLVRIP